MLRASDNVCPRPAPQTNCTNTPGCADGELSCRRTSPMISLLQPPPKMATRTNRTNDLEVLLH